MLKVSGVCQNTKHDYYYCALLWTCFLPFDLGLYKCIEFRVHGTTSSIVCPNRITAVLSMDPFFLSPDLCLHKCIEFRGSSKLFTGIIIEKECWYI